MATNKDERQAENDFDSDGDNEDEFTPVSMSCTWYFKEIKLVSTETNFRPSEQIKSADMISDMTPDHLLKFEDVPEEVVTTDAETFSPIPPDFAIMIPRKRKRWKNNN
jgi:hypothetical protein